MFSSRAFAPRRSVVIVSFIFLLAISPSVTWGASVYYLAQSSGNDGNDGLALDKAFASVDHALDKLQPGDELRIVGQLANPSFDPSYAFQDISDAHLWHGENTLRINELHGTEDAWITITSHDSDTVLKGDGGNIVRVSHSSYIRLHNLDVHGQVDSIPLETAKAMQFVYKDDADNFQYRVDPPNMDPDDVNDLTLPKIGGNVPRASYTDTRGVYVSDSHHIELSGSHVHHMPGGGVRFAKCEFVYIFDNEVDNNSRKSYSGTHGLVVTLTSDEQPREVPDGVDDYRVFIVRNRVHHNYNEIYSWVGTKDFVHASIDEGKGISLQRNEEFKNGGRILVANNVAYWNGYSGVHSNDGDNVDFFSNTAYMNSYTNTVWYQSLGEARSGNNIGVSMSGGKNCRIINNIAYIDTDWAGMPFSVTTTMRNPLYDNNLAFGEGPLNKALKLDDDFDPETVVGDPQLSNANEGGGWSFRPETQSPAIGQALPEWTPCEDFYGNRRETTAPSLGAVESNCVDGTACQDVPSPAKSIAEMMECYGKRGGADSTDDQNPEESGESEDFSNPSDLRDEPADSTENDGVSQNPKKEKAKKTKDAIVARVEQKLQRKAEKLADAALNGKQIRKLMARIAALNETLACLEAYDKASLNSNIGVCVATRAASTRRHLLEDAYDVEMLYEEDELDGAALATAEENLVSSGVQGVSSVLSVDPLVELASVPGVDAEQIEVFKDDVAEVLETETPEELQDDTPSSPDAVQGPVEDRVLVNAEDSKAERPSIVYTIISAALVYLAN